MNTKPLPLWKIYVPSLDHHGREFPVSKHKAWDSEVCKITGGMTLMRREEGRWVDPSGKIMDEPMIPVLLACTRKQLFEVIRYTLSYYKQHAVMAMKVTDEVWIVTDDNFPKNQSR